MILTPPMFWGLLTVASTNNKVYFRETDGATPVDLTATIPSGTYYPDSALSSESMASIIGSYMTLASTYGATYVVAVDRTDGTVTITASGGTLTGFALMLTTTETNKLLTGGDGDVGQQGLNHFGFVVDSAVPGYALTVAGDTQVSNAWHPQGPIANTTTVAGDDQIVRTAVSQVQSMGGRTVTRDFVGALSPTDVCYTEQRNFSMEFLSDADRSNYITYFYLPYAKTGGKFRYFPARSSMATYEHRILLVETAKEFAPQRLPGYPHFNTVIQTKLWKA